MEHELAQAIELISAQLGIAVEKIFGVFVGAQAIIGMMDILVVILTMSLAYITCKKVYAMLNVNNVIRFDDIGDAVFGTFIGGIVVCAVSFVLWTTFDTIAGGVLKIFCPEYTAMKEIIELAIR